MAETDPKSVQDLTNVVQTLLQQMQDKFQTILSQSDRASENSGVCSERWSATRNRNKKENTQINTCHLPLGGTVVMCHCGGKESPSYK
uniref:Heat shock factor binding protein 1a n=1 Tax=Haplochromis burtoni TaxID=8153 RepID=A0A3Q2VT12_HAPBU